MAFADELAALNEWHFFREFVYSRNTFQPVPGQEFELADSLIWLSDLLVAYQLKGRELVANANAETEKRWFERKVLKQATRQVRDTVGYLNSFKTIEVKNHRGHTFGLAFDAVRLFHKLVVYLPQDPLPAEYRRIKHHRSRTVGIIHIMPAHDYLGVVRTLLTPGEVAEYLSFREELIARWEVDILDVPEPALVGQYLYGDSETRPSIEFFEYLRRLEHRAEEWDMSGVIAKFPDRVTTDNAPTDYYLIVRELALLKRNELREFKKRFQMSVEKACANTFVLPYRIAVPRTNCGFVFVPLTKDMVPHRKTGLMNLTFAHKYDQRLPKCIGVSIADDKHGWFTAEWCYVESAWEEDPEMEHLLKTNNPFRDVKVSELPRYDYREAPSE
jgi:hypothetical protein